MTLVARAVAPHTSQFSSPLSVDPQSGELYLRNAPAIPVSVVGSGVSAPMVALAFILAFVLWRVS